MSVYHDFYAEVLFNGKWQNIDSHVLGLDNEIHHCPVIGGKSYLRDMLDELSEEIYLVPYEKLSNETQNALTQSIDIEYITRVQSQTYEVLDYQTAIKDRIKESPVMRGYVTRISIAMFRRGEIDSIEDWLTPDDYAVLDKSEQIAYSFFEWDDRDGWYPALKQIAVRVEILVDNFNECGIPYAFRDTFDTREIKTKDVRLVIRRS